MKNTIPSSSAQFSKQCEIKVQSCFLGDLTQLQAQPPFAVVIFPVLIFWKDDSTFCWNMFLEPLGRRAACFIHAVTVSG